MDYFGTPKFCPIHTPNIGPQKLLHFRKNIRSCAENECCCPRTVNISNVNFTSKIYIQREPVFKNIGQQMSGPNSCNGPPAQVETFSVSKTLTLSREHTFVCRKWMLFARAQFTFQMFTLLQIYIYKYKEKILKDTVSCYTRKIPDTWCSVNLTTTRYKGNV